MNLEKFTDRAKGFLQAAQTVAIRLNHQRIQPEHVLKALLDDSEGMAAGLIERAGGNAKLAVAELDAALAKVPVVSGSGASGAPGLDGDTGLYIRRPQRSAEPMGTLPVTAFRDYFACPYRFYLRHVLGLEGLDDTAVEMSGGLFGTVAHRVLREFGHSDLAASTDADQVEPFLLEKLEELVRWRFGSQPVAAVVLQKQQLEVRLSAFARRQVQWVSEGWRILPDHVEKHCKAELIVDGEPFIITGRVDRIDEHPELGYRIIDYKTSDSAAAPNKTHRSGGKWIDLQLPLYRQLAIAAAVDGAIELGYVLLPRDLAQVGWVPSGWDRAMEDSAVAAAEAIIRAVRVQRFWPPRDVPAFDDGFAGLCYDRVSDRSTTWANAVDGGTS